MMTMVLCNALSAFVEQEKKSAPSAAGASSAQCVGVTTTNMPMPMVQRDVVDGHRGGAAEGAGGAADALGGVVAQGEGALGGVAAQGEGGGR